MDRVVVVGAGLAGGRTAQELRRRGFTGQLTLVGAELHPPYDRPPLSKAVLAGRTDDTTLPLDLDDVEVLLGRRVVGLRPGELVTDTGTLDYDGLVLATGALPVTLPGDGPQRVLRTIDDARSLRDALKPGMRLAVVGAGWIGAEVATTAAKHGVEVTVVEAGSAPLAQALGEQVGSETIDWYARAGVELRLGEAVGAVRVGGLDLRSGEHLPADEVVVGVGVRPEVAWLDGVLELDRGVKADDRLAATWVDAPDAPPVYAVGDCAAWWSLRYGTRLRVEHWDSAQAGPAVVASNLLGGRESYDPVPYFWSEQFGRMIQYAGHRHGGETLVWRGSPSAGDEVPAGGRRPQGWAVGWFDGETRLVALATVGRPVDMVHGRKLLGAGTAADLDQFADLSVPLKQLLCGVCRRCRA